MVLMMRTRLRPALVLAIFAPLLFAGCATAPGRTTSADPWENYNRAVYRFNDAADRAALKPTARLYERVTPDWFRRGVSNFFRNLTYPTTIVNQALQGKPAMVARDTGRLLINSVLGLGGLFDVAVHAGLPYNDEDFGQTLAVWGVPSGPFFNIPLFGPSSARDAPSRIADYFTGTTRYVDVHWQEEWLARGLEVVNDRAELLQIEPQLEQVFDPYGFIRDAWVQRREFLIFDGDPPEASLEDLLEEADEEPTP